MPLKMVVLAKWVPDTKNITGNAMKEDGTVNRAALPAVFNPEDLNALEMALQLKEQHGGHVTVLTMGLPQASQLLRESLYRGADQVVLMTDRRFARADTLATSYTLACGIRMLGDVDLVLCGRQAIDGDTAQVGPQTAQKLGWPQVTYVERVESVTTKSIRVRRALGRGHELWETPLPTLLTVVSSANEPRPATAKLLIKFKNARCTSEIEQEVHTRLATSGKKPDKEEVVSLTGKVAAELKSRKLLIPEWKVEDVQAEVARVGGDGSPTKVKEIEFVVIQAAETRMVEPTEEGIGQLVHELIAEHTLG